MNRRLFLRRSAQATVGLAVAPHVKLAGRLADVVAAPAPVAFNCVCDNILVIGYNAGPGSLVSLMSRFSEDRHE